MLVMICLFLFHVIDNYDTLKALMGSDMNFDVGSLGICNEPKRVLWV